MSILKCKMCGGDLELTDGMTVCECEYCGSKQTVPTIDDEKKVALFTRANRLRSACEFDKAAGVYESIVAEFPEEAESYWGLVLCKYGIEYVDDPRTGKKIPTCHRSSFDCVLEDSNFQMVMEYSDTLSHSLYREEAKAIEQLRTDIIAVSSKEEPYDIFICYKETDEKGNRTIDSVIAQDVYTELTDKGYRVFFSRITLEDKLGQEYEPYIFAALNSAKVMLAFGTDYEYYNAVWVKNEWSRFLSLIEKGEKKTLIPCYKDIDAYDMPAEFKRLQAQDMGKVGAIQDLVRGIEKIVGKKSVIVPETVSQVTIPAGAQATVDSLLERAFMFLEDADWSSAEGYCEKILDIDPKNAKAYLAKLMIELKVKKKELLVECDAPFDNSNNYEKAIRFADEDLRKDLEGYIVFINERNEQARLEGIYLQAQSLMNSKGTESAYKDAARLFESISGYKDSAFLVPECLEKAEIVRKDGVFTSAKEKMLTEQLCDCEVALKLFESIPGWKEADECVILCKNRIEEIRVKIEKDRIEHERNEEIARMHAERIKKRNKLIMLITASLVCLAVVAIAILNNVIVPEMKYNYAMELMNEGNVVDAYEEFIDLNGYKDSNEKAELLYLEYEIEGLKIAQVGGCVFFGTYEQDGNTSNGKEKIEWEVLSKQGTRILVVSKKVLDGQQYNATYENVTWETSSIRNWLNDYFINNALSDAEKKHIPVSTVTADQNPDYYSDSGNATYDQIFLLSAEQVEELLMSSDDRKCVFSAYAKNQGAYNWWLRTPGFAGSTATFIASNGEIVTSGYKVNIVYGIRPAMWIELEP